MIWRIFLIAGLLVGAFLPRPAQAELTCEADIASLNFGSISVVDGRRERTSGPVTITCSGGRPGAMVHACVGIGSGSGGQAAGRAPRQMTGGGAALLEYQLTTRNSLSGGGRPWEVVEYKIRLDAKGRATVAPTLYAEVTSSGAVTRKGSYRSVFDAGSDVQITYGTKRCNQSGAVSSFSVAALIGDSCTVSVTNLDFGIISQAVAAAVNTTATISVTCSLLAAYSVGLTSGLQPVNTGATGRRMANGSNRLGYGVYRDALRLLSWGTGVLDVSTGVGTGRSQSLTVYGRIFANQTAVVGRYTDTVVVVVTY